MTDKQKNQKTLPVGDIEFFDNYLPSLKDGHYTIRVEQAIQGIDTGDSFQPIQQDFEVRGPQFAIDPTEIHGVYPPDKSSGVYGDILPHVVLNKRMLPWERTPVTGDQSIPWLALLLFRDNEISVNTRTNATTTTMTVEQFLTPDSDVMVPGINLSGLSDRVKAMHCQAFEIAADVFKALTPRKDELKYLAHVRQVNTGDQEVMGFKDRGWYSVVVTNRFPNPGDAYHAHLVSLEGLTRYLVDNPSFAKPKIRMLSLKEWSFTAVAEEGESFAQLMKHFVDQESSSPEAIMLRVPLEKREAANPPTPESEAHQRLYNGYIPLNYHTGTGEETFAWYRGPFTPVIAHKLPKTVGHYRSASEAMIFDEQFGVFDHSYAAAWQTGRALALAEKSFATTLLKFRRDSHLLVNLLLQRLKSKNLDTPDDLNQLLNDNLIKETFDQMVEEGLAGQLTELFKRPADAPDAVKKTTTAAATGSPVREMQEFLAQPEVQQLMQREVKKDLLPIAQWLAKLNLLYSVPFNHLVTDQRMLPVESLRFFYLDENWTGALMDGALSVGIESSRDSFFHQIMKGVIDDAVKDCTLKYRQELQGTATGDIEADSPLEARSGLLIRSALAAGWPGLQVKGYRGSTQLKTLRMDRLSPEVLLCIFLDVPDRVELGEPQQGLHFGVEDGGTLQLRRLSAPVGKPLGREFPLSGDISKYFRPAAGDVGGRVLNIYSRHDSGADTFLVNGLVHELRVDSHRFGPAAFALQMVKAPELQRFNTAT